MKTEYSDRMVRPSRGPERTDGPPGTMTYHEISLATGLPVHKVRYLLRQGVLREVPAKGPMIRVSTESVEEYMKSLNPEE